MQESNSIVDQFNRTHNYLRISLTEKCNLRCTYCMPEDGLKLTEKSNLMSNDEVVTIAKKFVELGIDKIRLTGGEPLVKKNIDQIITQLTALPISLSITTNGILLDRYYNLLKTTGVKNINISLDTLDQKKFNTITRRDYFDRVTQNINQFVTNGFNIKINVVLIKGFNDNEVIDFIDYTKDKNIEVRFIEFMPFDGNKWNKEKVVTLNTILKKVELNYKKNELIKLDDKKNDTTKSYKIKNYKGSFGIISTVSNPFCDSCNRIRLTANGSIKNCLFSSTESNLLTPLRNKEDIKPYIIKAVYHKNKTRGGMITDDDFFDKKNYTKNRSMIAIGG